MSYIKDMRNFGIEIIGNIPWGEHLCQFYENKEDLANILVPYFSEGLRNNEFCIWVTSPPLESEEAKFILGKAVPDLERFLKRGQLEIISYDDWYLKDGKFDTDRVMNGWLQKEKWALSKGFAGLRLTGNTFWVEKNDWKTFTDYEATINKVIVSEKIIALCCYPLNKCTGNDVVDVIRNHERIVMTKGNSWYVVENLLKRKIVEENLSNEREFSEMLINSSIDGIFAFDHEFKIVVWNPSMERITGMNGNEVLGKVAFNLYAFLGEDGDDKFMHDTLTGKVVTTKDRAYNIPEKGRKGYFEAIYSPLRGNNNRIVGGLAFIRDTTEKKRAEQELQQSQTIFRTLLNSNIIGIGVADYEGSILEANDIFLEMIGYSRDDLVNGKINWKDMTPPEYYDQDLTEWKRLAEHGSTHPFEKEYLKKDGTRVPVLIGATLLEKYPLKSICFIVNMTEVKETEKLRAASLYARSLIEASLDPLVTINSEGKITDVNTATEMATGLSRGELIGSDFSNYFTEPEKAREGYLQVFTKGYVKDYPLAIRQKTGKIIDVLYNATVYKNEKGEVQGVFAAARDVTERKLAEERIREQAERLDKANDAIIVRDLDNHIIYWNKGAERLYGWNSGAVLGKEATKILYRDSTQPIEALQNVLVKGEWSGQLKHVTKEGREVIVESRWTVVSDRDKNPKSIMTINTDVTEKKSLEAQFFRAQRLESLGTLAGGIAHDLNNILTPIMLSLGILDQRLTSKEDKKIIEMLQKNVKRGADLTKHILSFARGVEGERLPIQASRLISEIEKTIRETFPKSIDIRTEVDPSVPAIIGDITQLHQVLINLCLNARDAMPHGGDLNINVENVFLDENYARMHIDAKVGSYVCITITDSGSGMPPQVKERLFEPFFTTKKPGEGTGLGLSTALSIVKSHGGFINVYSEVGKGSSFKVYLPSSEPKGKDEVDMLRTNLLQGNGETVLVVDDEEFIRMTTTAALEANGYKTLTASDGAEAVGAYIEHRNVVQVVLLDVVMPIMDGQSTIRALRKINPAIRIVAMSGLAENGKHKIVTEIANAFISKPFTAEKLLRIISDVLSK